MSVSIKYGQDIRWGTSSAGTLTIGKILSASSKSTGKIFVQEDENDETYAEVYHDQREDVTLEVLAKPESTKPAFGSTITVVGITDLIVKESEEKWATGKGVMFSITASKSTK